MHIAGDRFPALLVLVLALAGIRKTIGFVAVSTRGAVTRGDRCFPKRSLPCVLELSRGVTETERPLPYKEQAQAGKRDNVDLTRENCASTCGGVAGTGPNQVDCNQIIDALNTLNTATFTMQPYSVTSWVQASCTIKFIQSTEDTVTYTYDYLGAVAGYLSDTCNAANGHAEGRCIFDGREDAIWVGNTAVSNNQSP
ncbi:hypothetical protein EV363DRAFT_1428501 [Boletus edulis]|uniref:Uncharacterized protein n=1 Tax=Boletus edulis BED1 TaxID=1328754 RepID=A0AAD4BRC8_BOLED|nr:hypothetical protein EV363DRAFT_1436894 [Boletus edulis]KAF8137640.1 hypothetical protein EV363DRAFT_1428501 [Boletus edulis]KAF8437952.1 hypothetical protein L210DRAFT_2296052 [Boletus edulis BED1]